MASHGTPRKRRRTDTNTDMEHPETSYMSVMPVEVIMNMINAMTPDTVMTFRLSSRWIHSIIKTRIIEPFSRHARQDRIMSTRDILEIIYHLNGEAGYNLGGIRTVHTDSSSTYVNGIYEVRIAYYPDHFAKITWLRNNVQHRTIGPSMESWLPYEENPTEYIKVSYEWKIDDQYHRAHKPAKYIMDDETHKYSYYLQGYMYMQSVEDANYDLQYVILFKPGNQTIRYNYDDDGMISSEVWSARDRSKPIRRTFGSFGSYQITSEQWADGRIHLYDDDYTTIKTGLGLEQITYHADGTREDMDSHGIITKFHPSASTTVQVTDDAIIETIISGREKKIITRSLDGMLLKEEWLINDSMHHRDNNPAEIIYRPSSIIERYYQYDMLHNMSGPAVIVKNIDGSIMSETFYVYGTRDSPNGECTKQTWYPSGQIKSQTWYFQNHRHREELPARIIYNKDGSVALEECYIGGVLQP